MGAPGFSDNRLRFDDQLSPGIGKKSRWELHPEGIFAKNHPWAKSGRFVEAA
jgi:hypothetical protein